MNDYYEINCFKCGIHLSWGISGDFNCLDIGCDDCANSMPEEKRAEVEDIFPVNNIEIE